MPHLPPGWVRVVLLVALGTLVAGCSVKRVSNRDPATDPPRQPYDFQGEAASPPPPAVPAEAAGQAPPNLDLEQPANLSTPPVAVQDLPAAALPPQAPPPAPGEGRYRVQVFASPDAAAAERLRAELEARFGAPASVTYQAPYYKVRVGDCPTNEACRELQERLRNAGYDTVWIVPDVAR